MSHKNHFHLCQRNFILLVLGCNGMPLSVTVSIPGRFERRTIPFATAWRLVIPSQIKLERASAFAGETLNRMTPPADTCRRSFTARCAMRAVPPSLRSPVGDGMCGAPIMRQKFTEIRVLLQRAHTRLAASVPIRPCLDAAVVGEPLFLQCPTCNLSRPNLSLLDNRLSGSEV